MKQIITTERSIHLLRIMLSICMMAHGTQRLYFNTVNGFGEFLNSKGFLLGVPIAWGITLFELIAGLALLLNFFTKWISLVWAFQLLIGIILVHAQQGWFVVGPSTGGVEYSMVLIVGLVVIHAHGQKKIDW